MTAVQKFLFETSFDGEPAGRRPATEAAKAPLRPVEAEPAPPPGYSEEDLAQARAAAFQEGAAQGREAGLAEAAAAREQALAQALALIAERLTLGGERLAALSASAERNAVATAMAVLRKLFPAWTQRHGQAEIAALIERCLAELPDEPRVVVRVADPHLDALQQSLDAAQATAGFEGKVVLLADDSVQPGDVRIEWADGGAERDGARTWHDIDGIIERALAAADAKAEPEAAPAASGD